MSVDIPATLTLDTGGFTGPLDDATSQVDLFGNKVAGVSDVSATGFLRVGSSLSHLGVSALVVADRIGIASEAVANAHERQLLATERLQEATRKWGAQSEQAIKAQQMLDISTRGVEIAQERYNIRVLFAVGSVLPSFITGISRAVDALRNMDIWNKITTLSTDELTTSQLALMAATGVGLVAAVGIAAAIAGGAFNVGTASSTQASFNFYGGNFNMQNTSDFAKTTQAQVASSSRG